MNAPTSKEVLALRGKRKTHLATSSEALRAAAEKKRIGTPLVIKGIGRGKLTLITLSMQKHVDVDPSYQRGETSMVREIISTVQSGGEIPSPPHLAKRRGSDTLWVVDGYQRICAYQQLRMEYEAFIHDSEGRDAEAIMYQALNNKKAQSANNLVKGWVGPVGDLIRGAAADPSHPLYSKVNFGDGGSQVRIGATQLLKAVHAVLGGTGGKHQYITASVDAKLNASRTNVDRAKLILRLIPSVFDKAPPKAALLQALCLVARERWASQPGWPTEKTISTLKAVNWEKVSPVQTYHYRPLFLEAVRKAWKA
ncbi:MAG: hypothetical protein IT349_19420 [Candidatus Eisenbacteria bacterium]|nr:hypothetical protein [Candidatus Eisenbacteria bacterium]